MFHKPLPEWVAQVDLTYHDKTTQDIRREVDRMLDNAEDAFQQDEAGALVSVANHVNQVRKQQATLP